MNSCHNLSITRQQILCYAMYIFYIYTSITSICMNLECVLTRLEYYITKRLSHLSWSYLTCINDNWLVLCCHCHLKFYIYISYICVADSCEPLWACAKLPVLKGIDNLQYKHGKTTSYQLVSHHIQPEITGGKSSPSRERIYGFTKHSQNSAGW